MVSLRCAPGSCSPVRLGYPGFGRLVVCEIVMFTRVWKMSLDFALSASLAVNNELV